MAHARSCRDIHCNIDACENLKLLRRHLDTCLHKSACSLCQTLAKPAAPHPTLLPSSLMFLICEETKKQKKQAHLHIPKEDKTTQTFRAGKYMDREERLQTFYSHIRVLHHTARCDKCEHRACKELKLYLEHRADCHGQDCVVCERLQKLFALHDRHCHDSKCSLPRNGMQHTICF
jgi:hypothetical protein